MLRDMEPDASEILICCDKKMSTVEAVTKEPNNRVYAPSSGGSPVNALSQFRCRKPVCDMVWAAVALDVSKSRFVFIDKGLKVNSQVYLNILQKKKFFLGSQKMFRTDKSSYRTMIQLTQRSLSLWLSVRRS